MAIFSIGPHSYSPSACLACLACLACPVPPLAQKPVSTSPGGGLPHVPAQEVRRTSPQQTWQASASSDRYGAQVALVGGRARHPAAGLPLESGLSRVASR